MSTNSSATVIEAQPDWLTATFYGERQVDGARELWRAWSAAEEAAGAKLQHSFVEGFPLDMLGRVRFGEKHHEAILQLSGQLADDHLDELDDVATRISRIDLAVTVRTAEPDPHVGANAYLEACWHYEQKPRAARPSRHTDADKGETVYLGSRDSERYFRLYNKEAECRARDDPDGATHYRQCWRYELELKRSVAAPTSSALARSGDRSGYCQQYLHDYLTGHGVSPLFTANGNRVLVPGFRRRSDLESRRAWLKSHARPVVAFAIGHVGREAVMRDLGLLDDPPAEPS